MTLPAHAAAWMDRAEIDYIGPFVKAWAAFNAWYRHASGRLQERDMLDYVKNSPNPARRGLLPLLRGNADTAAALSLRQAVYDLHQCLDAIDFEITRKGGTGTNIPACGMHQPTTLADPAAGTESPRIPGGFACRGATSRYR